MRGPALAVRLLVTIPGNPWAGRINARDRAGVTRDGRPYNRKRPGFAAYQEQVRLAALQARRAQQVAFGLDLVEVWISLWVPDRRRRDIDGPIKALLDGLTGAEVWADDQQVWALHVRKHLGAARATVLVARLTERAGAC